jgi:DeoR/GlpR family transcriptional regulator of sugar metabolism
MPTSKDLFLEERRQQILGWLEQNGRVAVTDLSQQLGVSEVTIRTDLQALAEQQLVIRTHGGAIWVGGGRYDLALTLRRQQHVQEKSRIGQAAAAMIFDDEAIFLDSSSTALVITQHLKQRRRLTIMTNGLAVAQEMLDAPGVTVVMPGGMVQRDLASLTGPDGLEMLRKFNIQKGFFGAHGLSPAAGLTDVSAEEAAVKQQFVEMSHEVIAVLDATKWGQVGLASFARFDQIDKIVTGKEAPADLVQQAQAAGIETILV